MLAGEPFDFLITLTDMQEHEHLNRQALAAGKHVWSEKPIANSLLVLPSAHDPQSGDTIIYVSFSFVNHFH